MGLSDKTLVYGGRERRFSWISVAILAEYENKNNYRNILGEDYRYSWPQTCLDIEILR